jgi:uncharacterized protein
MSMPLNLAGPGSGLVLGSLFGFILQRGGLGNGCKLTGQLRLEDWTVFNVMFTAIIVAATGLWILDATGYMPASATFVPTTYLWAALAGGGFVGLGMSIGGYCPGTSVVAAASGRVDGIFFFVGLVAGTLLFAGTYDQLGAWIDAAPPAPVSTLPELLRAPGWAIIMVLAVMAATVHLLVRRSRRRAIPAAMQEADR